MPFFNVIFPFFIVTLGFISFPVYVWLLILPTEHVDNCFGDILNVFVIVPENAYLPFIVIVAVPAFLLFEYVVV